MVLFCPLLLLFCGSSCRHVFLILRLFVLFCLLVVILHLSGEFSSLFIVDVLLMFLFYVFTW